MKNDFIDVTGIEFQGEFGNDTCKGIEKPGKYIIRVIDNNWDDGKENYRKDPVWGPIVKKMESLKYGTPEYKEVEAQYNKLFVEKFGVGLEVIEKELGKDFIKDRIGLATGFFSDRQEEFILLEEYESEISIVIKKEVGKRLVVSVNYLTDEENKADREVINYDEFAVNELTNNEIANNTCEIVNKLVKEILNEKRRT